MSYQRTKSIHVFFWHRFRRIYPAFWICIAVTAFVIAPLLAGTVGVAYFVKSFPLVTGVAGTIPRLMGDAPVDGISGSLWTLPWEMRSYVLVGILGVLTLIRLIPVLAGLFIAWAWLTIDIVTADGLSDPHVVNSYARPLTSFLCGVLFYVMRSRIPMRWPLFASSIGVLTSATLDGIWWYPQSGGLFYIVAPLPLTYAVFWLAIRLLGVFRRINTRNDFSYGIYIYGTLTLNVLTILGRNRDYVSYVALNLVNTFALAAASWFFIEKPAMGLKNARVLRMDGKFRFFLNGRPSPDLVGDARKVGHSDGRK